MNGRQLSSLIAGVVLVAAGAAVGFHPVTEHHFGAQCGSAFLPSTSNLDCSRVYDSPSHTSALALALVLILLGVGLAIFGYLASRDQRD